MFKKLGLMAVVMIGLMFVTPIASYAETVYVEAEAGAVSVWPGDGATIGASNESNTEAFGGTFTFDFTLETLHNQVQGVNHKIWLRQDSYHWFDQANITPHGIPHFITIEGVVTNDWFQYNTTGSYATNGWVWIDVTAGMTSIPGGEIALKPGHHRITIQCLDGWIVRRYDSMLVTSDTSLVPSGMAHLEPKPDGNLLLEAEDNYNGDHATTGGHGIIDETSHGPNKSGGYAVIKVWGPSNTMWSYSLSQAGLYDIWVRMAAWVGAPSNNNVYVDGVGYNLQFTGSYPDYLAGLWTWRNLGTYNQSAGEHTVRIQKLLGYDYHVYDVLLVTANEGSTSAVLEAEDVYENAPLWLDANASGGKAVGVVVGYEAKFVFVASEAGTYDISLRHAWLWFSGPVAGEIFIDEVSYNWQHTPNTSFNSYSLGSYALSAGPHIIRIVTQPNYFVLLDALVVSLPNEAPVAICQDITVTLDENGEAAIAADDVDGGSYDPDGDDITLSVDVNSFDCDDLGDNTVTLTVDDGELTDSCQATVTVVDDTAPTITSFSVSPSVIWPPNHKMVMITPALIASDNCDASVIYSVMSNEAEDGLGDGNTAPDWTVDGSNIQVRAERSGKGTGRVYTITAIVTDSSGNSSSAAVTVTVPHDSRK